MEMESSIKSFECNKFSKRNNVPEIRERYDKIKQLRLQGFSLRDIARTLKLDLSNISRQTSLVDREFSREENDSILKQAILKYGEKRAQHMFRVSNKRKRFRRVTGDVREQSLVDKREENRRQFRDKGVNSSTTGHAAEHFVMYHLARRGFDVLTPRFNTKCLDFVIIGKSGKFYRCEVKAYCSMGCASLTKQIHKEGRAHRENYTLEDGIDFIFLVNLLEEIVAVIPFSEVDFSSTWAAVNPDSKYWKFVNRFDLLN